MTERTRNGKLVVRPLTTALGAEIEGIDLSRRLGAAALRDVASAFEEHQVLVFRDQEMTPPALARLAEAFGPLTLPLLSSPGDRHPFVTELVREAAVPGSVRNTGDVWHSDQSIRECPSLGFVLYCLETPPYGGDTLFSSMARAYDALSDGMKALCERLVLVHCAAGKFGRDGAGLAAYRTHASQIVDSDALRVINAEMEHPLVRIHPVTGKKLLFVNGEYSQRFAGMTRAESQPLLDFLYRHASRPELTCRVRWQPGTLVLVDNRATLHCAMNDYAGFRRHLLRVEIAGDRPFGPALPRKSSRLRATA